MMLAWNVWHYEFFFHSFPAHTLAFPVQLSPHRVHSRCPALFLLFPVQRELWMLWQAELHLLSSWMTFIAGFQPGDFMTRLMQVNLKSSHLADNMWQDRITHLDLLFRTSFTSWVIKDDMLLLLWPRLRLKLIWSLAFFGLNENIFSRENVFFISDQPDANTTGLLPSVPIL